jgi:hypothetical protein
MYENAEAVVNIIAPTGNHNSVHPSVVGLVTD